MGGGERLGSFRFNDDLGDAVTVAQVDKHLIVIGASRIDPAVERHRLADVFLPEFATSMSSAQSHHETSFSSRVDAWSFLGRL